MVQSWNICAAFCALSTPTCRLPICLLLDIIYRIRASQVPIWGTHRKASVVP